MPTNNTLRARMLALISDVNTEVAEREELTELIAIALLTRKNLFILGAPGQAKSYAINAFRRRVTGARQFERLLSKQTDEEQLFGRIDLGSLLPGSVPESVLQQDRTANTLRENLSHLMENMNTAGSMERLKIATEQLTAYRAALSALHTGEPTVQTTGKLPEADIVFLDEIFKANDGILNALLTALNERKYTNEGRTYQIPVISFFAASNEIPNFSDPQEKILEALYDRLELKIVTENIGSRDKRLKVLRDKQAGRAGQIAASITLDELTEMQKEVGAVPVPEAINDLADDILCRLRKDGITVSDRKYLNYYPIAQAKAWLEGHTAVEPADLLILRHYLWQQPGDRPVVESALNQMCVNPLRSKVTEILAMAKEAQEEFDTVRSDPNRANSGSKALIKLRGELLRLYEKQQEISAATQSDSEKELSANLLSDLESISRYAHDAVGFTYAPLEQLAALQ